MLDVRGVNHNTYFAKEGETLQLTEEKCSFKHIVAEEKTVTKTVWAV